MIQTPYYLIDKSALLRNLQIIDQVRQQSGAKVLLALKCFATWSVFDVMRPYMDGTTSSPMAPGLHRPLSFQPARNLCNR